MISPLSQAQLSIYLACQGLKETDGNYQIAMLFPLPADIDTERLRTALEKVLEAHPYMLSRLVLQAGKPMEYAETERFMATVKRAMADPEMARNLSTLIAYTPAEGTEPEVLNWPSTSFTVQILLRLGFHWNTTSAAYLDQMFDLLSKMNYFA